MVTEWVGSKVSDTDRASLVGPSDSPISGASCESGTV